VGYGVILLGAKDQANRRIFIGMAPMFASVIEVKVHLTGIGVGKLSKLQVDNDKAVEPTMEKEEVNSVPFVANPQTTLTTDKSEVAPQFQKKAFQLLDEGLLQVTLRVFILQAKEFKYERVFNFFLWANCVPRYRDGAFSQKSSFVAGKSGAFVELTVYLPFELLNRPPSA
jgi:hypothetical protein